MTQETRTMAYEVGDTVTYRLWGGGLRTGVITEKFDDVKNGEPGFDMKVPANLSSLAGEPEMYWGYDEQIVAVDHEALS